MAIKPNKSVQYNEYNIILLERELKRKRTELQNIQRNKRSIIRNTNKFKQHFNNIIKKKELLTKILNSYKLFCKNRIDNICEINCNGSCKQLCKPIILTSKEIRSIIKMQIKTETKYKSYNKLYNEATHMMLCFRIFIKWYFDRQPKLDTFCRSMCFNKNLNYPNWECDEFFLCNELNWNFSIFS